ncbi:hypothetical protein P5641_00200 (plasmid) [Bacillus subtilis]|uniref:hypothetical protein n=1 Tax=Bacillus halotolerans TaxID=260554 RepID=UPI002570FA98|nr:hypothetical protein [Bacillus halotolerans]WEY94593.1 hypothetical protein P5641_00200 [Bacillus subtilis]WJE41167.1 hypothetical protein QRD86_00510 [Bacillus halotolerans]
MAKSIIKKTTVKKHNDLKRQMEELQAQYEQQQNELYMGIGKIVFERWDIANWGIEENPKKLETVLTELASIAKQKFDHLPDDEIEEVSSSHNNKETNIESSDYQPS